MDGESEEITEDPREYMMDEIEVKLCKEGSDKMDELTEREREGI